ncbi:MAG: sugar ABC transporter permease [Nocardioidaceae bacterium]|nr:sugar ABC transporter permease [Nocardioidaceae bacterium]
MKPSRPWTPYLFLLGPFAVFGFAVLAPMAMTVYYSLLDWNGYGVQTFIGLDNFKELMGDTLFRDSFKHVLLYIGATLVVEVAVGLLLAALATSGRGTRLWFRTAVFTPVMLPMVVVALLWGFIYNPDFGLANAGLDALGLGDWARAWLGDPDTALWAICVVSGWAFAGFYMTIFAASLASLPQDIIEAARLDGAGEGRLFWSVKLPMVRSSVEVSVLLCVTGGFQGFDLFYVLTNGGPYHATEIPTTYLVREVFTNGNVGYGSAMAVVLTVLVVAMGLVFGRLRSRHEAVA